MKKLLNVIVLTLAMNFLILAGGVAWLHQTGRLDRAKVLAIRDVLFAEPSERIEQPATTQPAEPSSGMSQPILRLEELLAKTTGRSATEQVQFLQQTFDAQMTLLERRERELNDLQRQVELARRQLARDREQFEQDHAALAAREEQATRLAADEGFQTSLQLYSTLPPKQVKAIFMSLDDASVMNYLQAMEPRVAARIVKEFKTPDELARVQRVIEKLRRPDAPVASAGDAQGKD